MKRIAILLAGALASPPPGFAQGTPEASSSPFALTQSTYEFTTAEQQRIRVTVVVKGLKRPWAVAFLPSGDALISERGAQIRYVHNAVGAGGQPSSLDPQPVAGLPPLPPARIKGGLHEVVLHPRFSDNHLVYITFNEAGPVSGGTAGAGKSSATTTVLSVMRGKLSGRTLVDVKELYSGETPSPSGSRLAFGKDGMLYVATGDNFYDPHPQQLDNASGKVLRLREDGTVPADNPFVGIASAWPEVYSYGHSAQYGLTVHPTSGALLSVENGPVGGDELNLILPGRNYGWPLVSFGRRESGAPLSESPVAEGIEQPLVVWLPGITPSGLTVYTGNRFPEWQGNLFVGAVRRGRMSYTGGLARIVVNEKLEERQHELLLTELRQRIRDVRQGPDGLLYLLTDESDGALLRIEPVEAAQTT